MKVYLVLKGWNYEGYEILSVFYSYEDAKNLIIEEAREDGSKLKWSDMYCPTCEGWGPDYYEIKEMELK